jgi:hypothetical protein
VAECCGLLRAGGTPTDDSCVEALLSAVLAAAHEEEPQQEPAMRGGGGGGGEGGSQSSGLDPREVAQIGYLQEEIQQRRATLALLREEAAGYRGSAEAGAVEATLQRETAKLMNLEARAAEAAAAAAAAADPFASSRGGGAAARAWGDGPSTAELPPPPAPAADGAEQTVLVQVPAGARAGQQLQIRVPDGRQIMFFVPPGAVAGKCVRLTIPRVATADGELPVAHGMQQQQQQQQQQQRQQQRQWQRPRPQMPGGGVRESVSRIKYQARVAEREATLQTLQSWGEDTSEVEREVKAMRALISAEDTELQQALSLSEASAAAQGQETAAEREQVSGTPRSTDKNAPLN